MPVFNLFVHVVKINTICIVIFILLWQFPKKFVLVTKINRICNSKSDPLFTRMKNLESSLCSSGRTDDGSILTDEEQQQQQQKLTYNVLQVRLQ